MSTRLNTLSASCIGMRIGTTPSGRKPSCFWHVLSGELGACTASSLRGATLGESLLSFSAATQTNRPFMADILASLDNEPAAKRAKADTVSGAAARAKLDPALCDRLRTEVLHLAACDGVLLGASGPFGHAPCSLLPYPFPAKLFRNALTLTKPFNTLVEKVSRDLPWLCETVRTTVAHDPFTRRLLEQLETVAAEGIAQPLQLSINRSDYMIDQPAADVASSRLLQARHAH